MAEHFGLFNFARGELPRKQRRRGGRKIRATAAAAAHYHVGRSFSKTAAEVAIKNVSWPPARARPPANNNLSEEGGSERARHRRPSVRPSSPPSSPSPTKKKKKRQQKKKVNNAAARAPLARSLSRPARAVRGPPARPRAPLSDRRKLRKKSAVQSQRLLLARGEPNERTTKHG